MKSVGAFITAAYSMDGKREREEEEAEEAIDYSGDQIIQILQLSTFWPTHQLSSISIRQMSLLQHICHLS